MCGYGEVRKSGGGTDTASRPLAWRDSDSATPAGRNFFSPQMLITRSTLPRSASFVAAAWVWWRIDGR